MNEGFDIFVSIKQIHGKLTLVNHSCVSCTQRKLKWKWGKQWKLPTYFETIKAS